MSLPNSVSSALLEQQDNQKEASSRPEALMKFERPEDLLMLRDILMNPPTKYFDSVCCMRNYCCPMQDSSIRRNGPEDTQ